MSLALATKGVIAQFMAGEGGYPVYTPISTPDVGGELQGSTSIFFNPVLAVVQGQELKPDVDAQDATLKPKMRADD